MQFGFTKGKGTTIQYSQLGRCRKTYWERKTAILCISSSGKSVRQRPYIKVTRWALRKGWKAGAGDVGVRNNDNVWWGSGCGHNFRWR